jgi:hypothetical protein
VETQRETEFLAPEMSVVTREKEKEDRRARQLHLVVQEADDEMM